MSWKDSHSKDLRAFCGVSWEPQTSYLRIAQDGFGAPGGWPVFWRKVPPWHPLVVVLNHSINHTQTEWLEALLMTLINYALCGVTWTQNHETHLKIEFASLHTSKLNIPWGAGPKLKSRTTACTTRGSIIDLPHLTSCRFANFTDNILV